MPKHSGIHLSLQIADDFFGVADPAQCHVNIRFLAIKADDRLFYIVKHMFGY